MDNTTKQILSITTPAAIRFISTLPLSFSVHNHIQKYTLNAIPCPWASYPINGATVFF